MSDGSQSFCTSESDAGDTVAAFLRGRLTLSWNQVRRYISTGKVFIDEVVCIRDSTRIVSGQVIALQMSAPRPRSPQGEVRIAYEDAHVVVIDKPAGISSVPYEPRETGTAMDLLRAAWRRKYPDARRVPLHIVHRIDKATSGLLMFAKSKRAEIGLGAQLRAHDMERRYLCVAHGTVRSGTIESRLLRDRGDGLRGSARHPDQGKRAVTHVRCIEDLRGASLCEVRLETGKTHQIRIHLAERGHPLVGEQVYVRDYLARGGEPLGSSRLLLHAATLGFVHPIRGDEIALEAPLPSDFEIALAELRRPTPARGPRHAVGSERKSQSQKVGRTRRAHTRRRRP